MSILEQIQGGADLRRFSLRELEQLCQEIRWEILRVVARNGGHLSSNLGAVELTVALHYVYDLPRDKLLFDVGHQCYAHKLLTGRLHEFPTLRRAGGLSGFPRRQESESDAFGAGHSGTAVSAALGFARAARLRGEDYHCVALVGDGAFMDGPNVEALNDAGRSELPLVVVLNDNTMSISKNVGALSEYLNRLRSNRGYWRFKSRTAGFLKRIPGVGPALHDAVYSVKNAVKSLLVHGQFFENLGFTYLGPIDGHNLSLLIRNLSRAKNLGRPVLVHAVTQKGYGYKPAEEKPDKYHGVAPYFVEREAAPAPGFDACAGQTLLEMAAEDPAVCVITAAMRDGTGVAGFAEAHPVRFFDVGIAEEHAVTLAAGLAAGGAKPFFAVYSTFLQRGYDQIVHDVALQNLHAVFLIGHAGLVGEDGATHQGAFDLSFLTHVPNLTLLAPSCAQELAMMLRWAKDAPGPVAIRYPKAESVAAHNIVPLQKGDWQVVSVAHRAQAVVFAVGSMVGPAMMAADTLALEGLEVEVVNCRKVKPLPDRMLEKYARLPIVTLEENAALGGFGAQVAVRCAQLGLGARVLPLGIPDAFIPHGTRAQQLAGCGLDVEGICRALRRLLGADNPKDAQEVGKD